VRVISYGSPGDSRTGHGGGSGVVVVGVVVVGVVVVEVEVVEVEVVEVEVVEVEVVVVGVGDVEVEVVVVEVVVVEVVVVGVGGVEVEVVVVEVVVVEVVVVEVVVVGGVVVGGVVVSVGPAQVPSGSQASNVLKKPSTAPHAVPFLHFPVLPTIDDLTFPFFFRTQQTAAFGLPQIDALSHFMMIVLHAFCGIMAVNFAALSVPLTHCLYVPCVCPSRVHPQVVWIIPRALSMAALSEHFALTQAARASGTGTDSTRAARATASRHFISCVPPRVRARHTRSQMRPRRKRIAPGCRIPTPAAKTSCSWTP
jgi:hypothetical protein